MAGTATSTRMWVLPSALLVALLASFNEWPSTSFQSDSGRSQLWQCPKCGWIERKTQRRQPPRCYGPAGDPHRMAEAQLLEGEGRLPSVGPRRFR
jgi:hypothetical protein